MNRLQQLAQQAQLNPVQPAAPAHSGRLNLYRLPWLRPLLESRWPQLAVRALTLAGFVFAIAAGLLGSPVGSHNFAIIFVWIAWWSAFKLVFIPFGGRSWCSICPIPLPGDWLQQGGILTRGRGLGLKLRWPRRLKGAWLQSAAFLLIGLFSALTLTSPRLSGWVLLGLFALATGLSLVFEKRAFCSSICPIGGFSGLYAQAAPLELRVLDTDICAKHGDKSCYQACPWGLYPVALRDSSACGLCLECLRACPKDNLALNLRPFSAELGAPRSASRLDGAFLALVMLGSALAFAAVFVGPWGWLKLAAYRVGSAAWWGYAAGFLALNLLALPGLFGLAVWAGGSRRLPGRRPAFRQVDHGLIFGRLVAADESSGIPAQAVALVLIQPHAHVIGNQPAHDFLAKIRARPPFGPAALIWVEINSAGIFAPAIELPEQVSFGARGEVVENHIHNHGDAVGMRSPHEFHKPL